MEPYQGTSRLHLKQILPSNLLQWTVHLLWRSTGSCSNGFLQVLAHEFPGTRYLNVFVTRVTDENWVIELLIRNGQLKVAASSTKYIPTVSVKAQKGGAHQKPQCPVNEWQLKGLP